MSNLPGDDTDPVTIAAEQIAWFRRSGISSYEIMAALEPDNQAHGGWQNAFAAILRRARRAQIEKQ